ncbi:MAG: VanZ family protein [Ignavibacteriaceae bacterium]
MLKYLLEKRKSVYALLTFYWLALFTATSIPASSVPTLGVSDKVKHFAAYMILTILLNITFLVQNKFPVLNRKSVLFTVIIASVYGIFDELHQTLIPGRSCEFLDWAADVGGILLGIIFVKILLPAGQKVKQPY